jgi:hypothetical protein
LDFVEGVFSRRRVAEGDEGCRVRVEAAIDGIGWELHKGGLAVAWESRGTRRYYYSATKRGGRVEKTYHGKGVFGELASVTLDRAKLRRVEQSEVLTAEKARLGPLVQAMAILDDSCRLMVKATLYAGGYHNFNRV